MGRKFHVQHGRYHAANGEDPIPGLGGAADWAYLEMYSGMTVTAGSTAIVAWDSFRSNRLITGSPPTDFPGFYTAGTGPTYNTAGDTQLQWVGYGPWYAHASFQWATGISNPNARLSIAASFGMSSYDTDLIQTFSTSASGIWQWQTHSGINFEASDGDIALAGRQFECSVKNGDGSSRTLNAVSLVVVTWSPAVTAHDLVYGIAYT